MSSEKRISRLPECMDRGEIKDCSINAESVDSVVAAPTLYPQMHDFPTSNRQNFLHTHRSCKLSSA